MAHFMNKTHGRHMGGDEKKIDAALGSDEGDENIGDDDQHPSIHVHSHAKGHTVHVMHHDGRHEKHEHGKGDAKGIANHVHRHIGGAAGQSHGSVNEGGASDELDLEP